MCFHSSGGKAEGPQASRSAGETESCHQGDFPASGNLTAWSTPTFWKLMTDAPPLFALYLASILYHSKSGGNQGFITSLWQYNHHPFPPYQPDLQHLFLLFHAQDVSMFHAIHGVMLMLCVRIVPYTYRSNVQRPSNTQKFYRSRIAPSKLTSFLSFTTCW